MSLQHWLLYLSVVAAVIVTPGPSAALCLTHGARHGVWRATATVLGGMVASLTLMTLSALGMGAAIAASTTLFLAIKFAGAAYLIWLGIAMWRAPAAPATNGPTEPSADHDALVAAPAAARATHVAWGCLWRQGLLVGIGNPKDLLFFGALFPQFLDPTRPMAPQFALLAATWLVVDGLAMTTYAAIGTRIGPALRRSGAGRLFNRLTGGAFIAAGGALALANR
jgi:threonine/homoserine/homoserine lactone efflux protein